MNRRNHRTLIVVLAITVVIFIAMGVSFAVYQNTSVSGANAVGFVFRPVQKLFTKVGTGVSDFFSFVSDMKRFQTENAELRGQLDQLEQENRELKEYREENTRLRQWLELKDNNPEMDLVLCEVIAKDPGNWFKVFTIDKGTGDNIRKDDVVITTKGLVGRVIEVGRNWAKVVSIIDTDSSIGALISRTRDIAIIDGDLVLAEEGKCRLNYVSNDANIVVGDTIETSGLGGIYPKGLFVGTVAEVHNDLMGYSQYAVVEPAVDFKRVREVAVIRSGAEEPEE